MSIVKNPSTVDRGVRAEFQKALAETENVNPILDKIFMKVRSTVKIEKQAWLEQLGTLKEVLDEVEIDGVLDSNQTLENKTYAKAFGIKLEDLEDDQVQGALQRSRDLTVKGRLFPTKLLFDQIIANSTAYDGVAFFATTHATGASGTQSNLLTGTGTSLAQLKTDFDSAIQAMLAYNNAEGEPIYETDVNFKPVVLCPTSLYGLFRDLQESSMISSTTNTIKGAFDLVQSARLNASDVNDWYLFDAGGMMKPWVLQERVPLELSSSLKDSEYAFFSEKVAWKIRWRGAVGPGFWQSMIKTTNT